AFAGRELRRDDRPLADLDDLRRRREDHGLRANVDRDARRADAGRVDGNGGEPGLDVPDRERRDQGGPEDRLAAGGRERGRRVVDGRRVVAMARFEELADRVHLAVEGYVRRETRFLGEDIIKAAARTSELERRIAALETRLAELEKKDATGAIA